MATSPPHDGSSAERLRAELGFMYELSNVVASHSELQPILDWIVGRSITLFGAEEGSIRLFLEDEPTGPLRTRVRHQQPGVQSGSWPADVSTNVMGFLMVRGETLASPDLVNDARFAALRGKDTPIRAVLAAPLKVGNRFTGLLAVTHSVPGRDWSSDERQLLSILAANSASVIEQARLKIEAEAKQRLERELETARGIQMSLLPPRPLRAGPWELAGRLSPAQQVGGDAFDFFALPDGRFGLMIADVSGKGVPAALLMANVLASVRAFCDGRTPPREAIRAVNEAAVRHANGRFITLFYAELDPAGGALRYVNAGHNYPLVRRADGTLVELVAGGLPLGLMASSEYAEGTCPFAVGDALLLFSDGLTEAHDSYRHEFGDERLRALWAERGGQGPRAMIDGLFAAVEAFRGAALPNDDMTVVVAGAPEAP